MHDCCVAPASTCRRKIGKEVS